MKRLRGKLTYANVMATIAVFLVLSGGAAVAAGLAKNSVGPKQLKKNAVTAAKIKNGAVTGAKINAATLPPVPTAANASSLGGLPASSYSIRSATVAPPGTVVAAQSDGIAQGNLNRPEPGFYCFNGLNPAPRTAVAVLGFGAENEAEIFAQVSPGDGPCAGSQLAIATEGVGGGAQDEPFSVIVH